MINHILSIDFHFLWDQYCIALKIYKKIVSKKIVIKKFLLTTKMLLLTGKNDDYDFHIDNNGGNVDVIDDDDVDYKELGRVPCTTPT